MTPRSAMRQFDGGYVEQNVPKCLPVPRTASTSFLLLRKKSRPTGAGALLDDAPAGGRLEQLAKCVQPGNVWDYDGSV
jgi:hypothetical protein